MRREHPSTARIGGGHLISRREYLRMLVTLSGGLLFGTVAVAAGAFRRRGFGAAPATRIADTIPHGRAVTFSYPTDDDPAIALRLPDGRLVAYSSVCTHLGCAVLWSRPSGRLECPCHNGAFDPGTGRVTAGPAPRPLPGIHLEERDDGIYAIGTAQ